jgi:aldehyde dehydrogenase (NAD+)
MTSVMLQPSDRRVAVSATKLLINNRWIASESGETFATIDLATGAEICPGFRSRRCRHGEGN